MTPTPEQNAKRVIELSEEATKEWWPLHPSGGRSIHENANSHEPLAVFRREEDCELAIALRTAAPELAKAYLQAEIDKAALKKELFRIRKIYSEQSGEFKQLRLAADGMRDALVGLIENYKSNGGKGLGIGPLSIAKTKLAAYRAAGEGLPSNPSNSPTDSRDSQG